MKLKYFLRGLGAGIVFGAIIMLAAYMTSGDYKLSDQEIIKRAEKLGMVMEETNLQATNSDTNVSKDVLTDQNDEKNVQDIKVDNTDEPTTETTTSEPKNEPDDSKTTESNKDDSLITAKITVTSGMTSTQVAELLQSAGIIEDHELFDTFLNEKGYSTQIRVKTCEVNNKMTFEEIAKELISGTDD